MKEIKDYLHFYFGGDCLLSDEFNENVPSKIDGLLLDTLDDFKTIKPILRPLSDMTEEEKTEIGKLLKRYEHMGAIGSKHFDYRHERVKEEVVNLLITADEDDNYRIGPSAYFQVMPYLLKQGFDLFGLIDSGLALNKTTHSS